MLKRNNMKKGLCNGSVGTIQSINQDESTVTVLFDNGEEFEVKPIIKFKDGSGVLYSEKLPLTCAHALTIHKA